MVIPSMREQLHEYERLALQAQSTDLQLKTPEFGGVANENQVTQTSVAAIDSLKRKRTPRKLDSEKCQQCRLHKVKCNPQPRIWPQRCDRCASRNWKCSPPEPRQRAKKRIQIPSSALDQVDPEHLGPSASSGVQYDSDATEIFPENVQGNHDEFCSSEDVFNIVTVVQLLNSENDFLQVLVDSLMELLPRLRDRIDLELSYKHDDVQNFLEFLRSGLSFAFENRIVDVKARSTEGIILIRALEDLYKPAHVSTANPLLFPEAGNLPVGLMLHNEIRDIVSSGGRTSDKQHTFSNLIKLSEELAAEISKVARKLEIYPWSTQSPSDRPLSLGSLIASAAVGIVLSGSEKGFVLQGKRCLIQNWVRDVMVRNASLVDVGIPHESFLSIRSGKWDLSHLDFLIGEAGGDISHEVDDEGQTLLHVEIISGNSTHVDLLARCAQTSQRKTNWGYTVFHYAAAVGDVSLYEKLRLHQPTASLEEIRGPNEELPLHIAAAKGHTPLLEAILSSHPSESGYVNKDDNEGSTALGLALEHGHDGTVRFLASYPGIDFIANKDLGYNALHMAAALKSFRVFSHLLSRMPEELVNMRDDHGGTPLHLLAKSGDRETIDAILRIPSIQLNRIDEDGKTPLAHAVANANLEAVKALAIRRDVSILPLRDSRIDDEESVIELAKARAKSEAGRPYREVLGWLQKNFRELKDDLVGYGPGDEGRIRDMMTARDAV